MKLEQLQKLAPNFVAAVLRRCKEQTKKKPTQKLGKNLSFLSFKNVMEC